MDADKKEIEELYAGLGEINIASFKLEIDHSDEAEAKMIKLIENLKTISQTDASILLTGETGVGKEVLARFVHENSKRKKEPFVAVNCSAISENLLESEFFGHEKGSYFRDCYDSPMYFNWV